MNNNLDNIIENEKINSTNDKIQNLQVGDNLGLATLAMFICRLF